MKIFARMMVLLCLVIPTTCLATVKVTNIKRLSPDMQEDVRTILEESCPGYMLVEDILICNDTGDLLSDDYDVFIDHGKRIDPAQNEVGLMIGCYTSAPFADSLTHGNGTLNRIYLNGLGQLRQSDFSVPNTILAPHPLVTEFGGYMWVKVILAPGAFNPLRRDHAHWSDLNRLETKLEARMDSLSARQDSLLWTLQDETWKSIDAVNGRIDSVIAAVKEDFIKKSELGASVARDYISVSGAGTDISGFGFVFSGHVLNLAGDVYLVEERDNTPRLMQTTFNSAAPQFNQISGGGAGIYWAPLVPLPMRAHFREDADAPLQGKWILGRRYDWYFRLGVSYGRIDRHTLNYTYRQVMNYGGPSASFRLPTPIMSIEAWGCIGYGKMKQSSVSGLLPAKNFDGFVQAYRVGVALGNF